MVYSLLNRRHDLTQCCPMTLYRSVSDNVFVTLQAFIRTNMAFLLISIKHPNTFYQRWIEKFSIYARMSYTYPSTYLLSLKPIQIMYTTCFGLWCWMFMTAEIVAAPVNHSTKNCFRGIRYAYFMNIDGWHASNYEQCASMNCRIRQKQQPNLTFDVWWKIWGESMICDSRTVMFCYFYTFIIFETNETSEITSLVSNPMFFFKFDTLFS